VADWRPTVRYHLGRLFDHVHLRVADLEASRRFYRAALGALGTELAGESADHFWVDELYVSADGPATTGLHLAFQAEEMHVLTRSGGLRERQVAAPAAMFSYSSWRRGQFAKSSPRPFGARSSSCQVPCSTSVPRS
jgi:catechol 2,3-dioxygenase-like lactoylglutathione lyase family enzyme